jgi:FG-GAP-like repeat
MEMELDLAVASGYGGTQIWIGNGDGTFTAGASMSNEESLTSWIATADFNGDHMPDIVMNVCRLNPPSAGRKSISARVTVLSRSLRLWVTVGTEWWLVTSTPMAIRTLP